MLRKQLQLPFDPPLDERTYDRPKRGTQLRLLFPKHPDEAFGIWLDKHHQRITDLVGVVRLSYPDAVRKPDASAVFTIVVVSELVAARVAAILREYDDELINSGIVKIVLPDVRPSTPPASQ